MPDDNGPGTNGPDDMTAGHPTTRHLRTADAPAAEPQVSGPYSGSFPAEAHLPYDVICYGPDIPDDRTYRLLGNLGNLEGKRVLELGCGGGHAAIALAKQGAKVISVDPSKARLDQVRQACEREEVRVELHQADLAELPFVRADTIDAVLSIYSLATVPDLDRVFRQAHRVLRAECNFVFSVPHPAFAVVEPGTDEAVRVARSYFDRTPRPWAAAGAEGMDYPRTLSELVTSLSRANFRVDTLLEPEIARDSMRSKYFTRGMQSLPATLIIRARKEGI